MKHYSLKTLRRDLRLVQTKRKRKNKFGGEEEKDLAVVGTKKELSERPRGPGRLKRFWNEHGNTVLLTAGGLAALGAAGVGLHKLSKTDVGKNAAAIAKAQATVATGPARRQMEETRRQLGQTGEELRTAGSVVHAAGQQAVEASKLAAVGAAGKAAATAGRAVGDAAGSIAGSVARGAANVADVGSRVAGSVAGRISEVAKGMSDFNKPGPGQVMCDVGGTIIPIDEKHCHNGHYVGFGKRRKQRKSKY